MELPPLDIFDRPALFFRVVFLFFFSCSPVKSLLFVFCFLSGGGDGKKKETTQQNTTKSKQEPIECVPPDQCHRIKGAWFP